MKFMCNTSTCSNNFNWNFYISNHWEYFNEQFIFLQKFNEYEACDEIFSYIIYQFNVNLVLIYKECSLQYPMQYPIYIYIYIYFSYIIIAYFTICKWYIIGTMIYSFIIIYRHYLIIIMLSYFGIILEAVDAKQIGFEVKMLLISIRLKRSWYPIENLCKAKNLLFWIKWDRIKLYSSRITTNSNIQVFKIVYDLYYHDLFIMIVLDLWLFMWNARWFDIAAIHVLQLCLIWCKFSEKKSVTSSDWFF